MLKKKTAVTQDHYKSAISGKCNAQKPTENTNSVSIEMNFWSVKDECNERVMRDVYQEMHINSGICSDYYMLINVSSNFHLMLSRFMGS